MKLAHNIFLVLLSMAVLGCSSYKAKKQEAQLILPELGTLVKTKGGILYSAVEQIGTPNWKNLKVEVQQLPFNIESYVTYAKHMRRAGKINSIPYNDSLRYKPKYLRLQLLDKVNYTVILNEDKTKELRNYLSLDENHRLVTAIDVAFTEDDMQLLLNAPNVLLTKDNYNNMVIEVTNGNTKTSFPVKDLPTFNYGLSAFCWGEDRYHNRRIQNIVSEEFKCPKGSYLKASKIDTDRAYLKF
ncbi:hypothetical protein [uncultured Croceitalea sp.]|uniref:hypothetical protein n=1 Tax=uncultured Croceitalea sp. TaxID=1798908 RepID=UPI00374E532E